LAASDDLGEEIRAAIRASRFLIVLCSPAAAQSRWANAEVETFKRGHPQGCVFAAIVDGEPFASDIPGREAEECLPRALRFHYDRRGRPTARRAEPMAADLRDHGDGRRMGFLKIVAGMLGVGLDELVQRDTMRRQRRMGIVAAASLAGMAVTSTLAVTAIHARDAASEQRRAAEGLVSFMLGDLKSKLEPIGRLDALDGVGSRVLAYYKNQDTAELSDAALLQRSRALSLMAQVSYERGHLDDSARLFREAMAGTGEAIERNPNDPRRLYDHAQNFFYLGEIARQRSDFTQAEKDYREYQRLANRMVALEPDNLKWRMEAQYGQANVGIALFGERHFAEAKPQFAGALRTIEALASVDPSNEDYQDARSQALAWVADTERAQGHFDQAIALRERQAALLDGLVRNNSNVAFREASIPAHQALGILYASRGQFDHALPQLQAAVDLAGQLIPVEPENDVWKRLAASARLELGKALLAAGKPRDAAQQIRGGCALVAAATSAARTAWRALQTQCFSRQAVLALASDSHADALRFASQAVSSARLEHGGDPISNHYRVAAAYRLLGNARSDSGDPQGAREAWTTGLSLLPENIKEKPQEMYEHAELLRRLGRADEARPIEARLTAIGYRSLT
jgi:tetratricopeptide (TPR) repeat protein